MLLRFYVYLHVLAVALAALAAHWDAVGLPNRALLPLFYLGIASASLVLVFPIACLILLATVTADRRDKYFTFAVGCLATLAHLIAALPLVQ